MNRFYVLEPEEGIRFGTKWAYAEEIDPVNLGDADVCPVCGLVISLMRWLPPYRVKLSSAKPAKWGDFLWVGGTVIAVSERLKDIFTKEGLRGLESFEGPLEIIRYGTRKTGDFPIPPPKYFVVKIPWGRANQDDAASEVTERYDGETKCVYCRTGMKAKAQKRIIIDEQSWDGSDIFKPRGAPVQCVVSERFKHVIDRWKISNTWLIPTEKYGYNPIGRFIVHD